MRHAQTLNEAQFRKVLHYCRTRRHANRDTAIFMVSFFAGLRAKEIAALKLGDVFDADGRVREQFTLESDQTKGGQRRSVFINKRLAKALDDYGLDKNFSNLERPLFESQKGGHFSPNTMCQLFLDILKTAALKMPQAIQVAEPILPDWQTREWVCACWLHLRGILISPPHKDISM